MNRIVSVTEDAFLNGIMRRLRGRFARNVGWMGFTQVLSRVFRLTATVVAARILLPEDYGLAAIVLAAHEIFLIIARRLTTTFLVQSKESEIDEHCASAWSLNWAVCAVLLIVQCSFAFTLAGIYETDALIYPLCVLAGSYLLLPLGMVHAALNVRAGRIDVVAKADVGQSLGDALLTVVFALSGFGVWALVLPKVLVVPIWFVAHRITCAWRVTNRLHFGRWREILAFGCSSVGVNLLTVVRNNADYILVGKFLGVEALGIYYFAYNAGIGISLGIINGFSVALLPHLCRASEDQNKLKARFRRALSALALIVGALVLAQSLLAPLYVPLIFGQRWVDLGAVPILVLICLSALPRALGEACSQLLHARGLPGVDFKLNSVLTLIFVIGVSISAPFGLLAVAVTVFAVTAITVPVLAFLAWRRVFGHPYPPEQIPAPASEAA